MSVGWIHQKDPSDEWEGTNDAASEWFKNIPLSKFAREGIQNSIDAASQTGTGKVIVKFRSG